VNGSVKLLLKSVGLRRKGPKKIGILDRFIKERQKIGINISWRKALGKDWRDAEIRCIRLQEFQIGDPSSWVLMLDTFNEVLVQNFSRSHPTVSAAFARATRSGKANPDYGAWLNQNDLNTVIPVSKMWFLEVHNTRVKADLAHAKSSKGKSTRSVTYQQRETLLKGAATAWAQLIQEWKRIL
jgi:hypothetical protein